MTETHPTNDHTEPEAGAKDKRPYAAPSLVRYGPLFANTGAKTCSPGSPNYSKDFEPTDPCNPPDGDSGKKADSADGTDHTDSPDTEKHADGSK